MKKTIILSIFLLLGLQSLTAQEASEPNLQISLSGISFVKGDLDAELISELIAQKQKEIKATIIKDNILKEFEADSLAFFRAYFDVALNYLLFETDPEVITRNMIELNINTALVFAYAELLAKDRKTDVDGEFLKKACYALAQNEKIREMGLMRQFYNYNVCSDGTSSDQKLKFYLENFNLLKALNDFEQMRTINNEYFVSIFFKTLSEENKDIKKRQEKLVTKIESLLNYGEYNCKELNKLIENLCLKQAEEEYIADLMTNTGLIISYPYLYYLIKNKEVDNDTFFIESVNFLNSFNIKNKIYEDTTIKKEAINVYVYVFNKANEYYNKRKEIKSDTTFFTDLLILLNYLDQPNSYYEIFSYLSNNDLAFLDDENAQIIKGFFNFFNDYFAVATNDKGKVDYISLKIEDFLIKLENTKFSEDSSNIKLRVLFSVGVNYPYFFYPVLLDSNNYSYIPFVSEKIGIRLNYNRESVKKKKSYSDIWNYHNNVTITDFFFRDLRFWNTL